LRISLRVDQRNQFADAGFIGHTYPRIYEDLRYCLYAHKHGTMHTAAFLWRPTEAARLAPGHLWQRASTRDSGPHRSSCLAVGRQFPLRCRGLVPASPQVERGRKSISGLNRRSEYSAPRSSGSVQRSDVHRVLSKRVLPRNGIDFLNQLRAQSRSLRNSTDPRSSRLGRADRPL
jgi:hypothetical protein